MSTIIVDTFAITDSTRSLIITAERAGKKADSTNAAAFDALYADGLRAEMIYDGSEAHTQIKDLVLGNRFTAAQRKLYNTPKKEIDSVAVRAERTELRGRVSARIGDYTRAMKGRAKKEEATEAAKVKKVTETSEATEVTEVKESTETVTPNQAIAEANTQFLKNIKEQDGYFNATAICKAGEAFIKELLKQPK